MASKIQRVPVLPSPENLKKLTRNPSSKHDYDGNAFVLTSSVPLTPQSDGTGNVLALKNPNPSAAMEVMALTFQILPGPEANGDVLFGDSIAVSITADGVALTNGFVPIWLLSGIQPGHLRWTADTYVGYVTYIVPLDIPMWLPPGAEFDVSFLHNGVVNISATVWIGIEARRTKKPRPAKRMMPYFTSYVSQQTDYKTADTFASTENQLMNGSGTDVDVRRLVGRVGVVASFSGSSFDTYGEDSYLAADASSNNYFIQLSDSEGFPMVEFPTAFGSVFEFVSRSWETKFKMSSGAYLNASGTVRAGQQVALSDTTILTQIGIGVVGYMEA